MRTSSILLSGLLTAGAQAQLAAYAQCGGPNWTGTTTCVSGYYCLYQSQWYSQCVPGTAGTTAKPTTTLVTSTKPATSSSTKASTTTSTAAPPTSSGTGKFKWFGINESGAEFGQGNYPGVWGTHFIFPANSALDVRSPRHILIFRVRLTSTRPSSAKATTFSALHSPWSA